MVLSTFAFVLLAFYSVSGAPEQQIAEVHSFRVELSHMRGEIQGLKNELENHKIMIDERKMEIKVLQEEIAEFKAEFDEDEEEGQILIFYVLEHTFLLFSLQSHSFCNRFRFLE